MDLMSLLLFGAIACPEKKQVKEKKRTNDLSEYEEWKNSYDCRERYIWDRNKMKFIDKELYDKEH